MECSELLLFGGIWGRLNMVNLRIDAGLIVVVEWGICHTRFQKETRCILYVLQDQVHTHTIDVISEIYQR
jgi:hypothetical protein